MVKYSVLISRWLKELGYTHCFYVAGGGIMHLLDGVRNIFECIPVVHEVTAGIAAEHFNECSVNGKAFALVTTGPGLTNIVTAIAGCYVEHRELLVLAGQVKSTDMLTFPERQRGVQEIDGQGICKNISTESVCLKDTVNEKFFKQIVLKSSDSHPGPVLLEVCLDVQGEFVDEQIYSCSGINASSQTKKVITEDDLELIQSMIKESKRPVLLLGGLVKRATSRALIAKFDDLGIPIATTTSAIDRYPSAKDLYVGRPGTWGGQRHANLIVAQSDLILVLGAQLDLQQTGFNFQQYAPNATLIHVFPSKTELNKAGIHKDIKINVDPNYLLNTLIDTLSPQLWKSWVNYVCEIKKLVPNLDPANTVSPSYINSFEFYKNLSVSTSDKDILALCSSGGTFSGCLQTYEVKQNQIATTSAAHASMGYGLATAIGASFSDKEKTIVLTEGEGGFSQNMQELAVISKYQLPVKIFVIDNNGYASIRATQRKFFNGAYMGCDSDTGLGFPDWITLFNAFNIKCNILQIKDNNTEDMRDILHKNKKPEAWIVKVDPNQTNWPSIQSRVSKDGSMESSPIYDMQPKLNEEIFRKVTKYL